MIVATIAAWNRNDTRQLTAVVISPPISGPAAAPIPAAPLIEPNARARDSVSLKYNVAEDVDRRDHQSRADALEGRVADDQHAEAGGESGDHRAGAVDGQAER